MIRMVRIEQAFEDDLDAVLVGIAAGVAALGALDHLVDLPKRVSAPQNREFTSFGEWGCSASRRLLEGQQHIKPITSRQHASTISKQQVHPAD